MPTPLVLVLSTCTRNGGNDANSLAEKRLRSLIESDIRRERREKESEKELKLAIKKTSPKRAESNLTKAIERPGQLVPTPVPEKSDILGVAITLENAPDTEDGKISSLHIQYLSKF